MAVTSVSCVGTVSSSLQVGGQRSYTVKYIVITTDPEDQAVAVSTAPGIPQLGQYYSVGNDSDAAAFVSEYAPRLVNMDGSRKVWEVMVTFSTRSSTSPGDGSGSSGNIIDYDQPWMEPVTLQTYGIKSEELARWRYLNTTTGATGYLTNSAGAYLDDVYRDVVSFVLSMSVKYRYQNWSPTGVIPYTNTLNASAFFGITAGYCKMTAPRSALMFTGESIPYWDVQYEFEGRYHPWNGLLKIDEGYWYIDIDDASRMKRFSDDMGLAISGKGRLNGIGDKLDPWEEPVYIYGATGIDLYRETNYANLGIPTTVADLISGNFTRALQ